MNPSKDVFEIVGYTLSCRPILMCRKKQYLQIGMNHYLLIGKKDKKGKRVEPAALP